MIGLVAFALGMVGQNPRTSTVRIDRLEARLYYEGSGRLSDNLLARAKAFTGWNTIIGEGDAEEIADDLLVAVRLTVDSQEQENIAGPVELTVQDASKKTIGKRTWKDVLTSKDGAVVLPLWLNDVGCAGILNVTARYGAKSVSNQIELHCGE
jgi:hypothetical protein